MTATAHILESAPGLASLPPEDPERVAAYAHARGCAECATALREAEGLLAALDDVPPAPAPAARTLRAIAEPILVRLSALAVPTRWLSGVLVCLWLVLVVLAKHRAGGAVAWVESGALAATAVACLVLFRRLGSTAVGLVMGASVVMAAIAWEDGPPARTVAMACLLTELGAALVPLAIVARAFVKRRSARPTAALVLAAAAGALVAQAALHLTCPGRHAGAHLLVSHCGGVAVAALLALLAGRFVVRPAETGRADGAGAP
jgi:hypothetical protein